MVTNYQIDRRYVYDGQHIVLELDGVTNTSDSADDVIRRVMHGQAIDEVLAEETASGTSWALSDHLGTIRDWGNAATGSVEHYVYSVQGRILTINGGNPKSDTHLFGFTGRETDADTHITDAWMYYRARYYDPSAGRFVSPDPIGFAAGDANLYRYVANHATLSVDPSGLAEGHHWVPVDVSFRLWNEGVLTQFEAEYFSGRRSGSFSEGVVHNFSTEYNGVKHPQYNDEVCKQLKAWKAAKNSKQFPAHVVADHIRDGKCWNGAPNATLRKFNDGVKSDLRARPDGSLNKMNGEGDTPEKVAKKGRTSMRRRGKEILLLGAVMSTVNAIQGVSQGAEVSNILVNGEGIRKAIETSKTGDVYLLERALIGNSESFKSVYEEINDINQVAARAFFAEAHARLPELHSRVRSFDQYISTLTSEDDAEWDIEFEESDAYRCGQAAAQLLVIVPTPLKKKQ